MELQKTLFEKITVEVSSNLGHSNFITVVNLSEKLKIGLREKMKLDLNDTQSLLSQKYQLDNLIVVIQIYKKAA
jgi:hypothetical protein